jgi:hypothetical protein
MDALEITDVFFVTERFLRKNIFNKKILVKIIPDNKRKNFKSDKVCLRLWLELRTAS